MLFASLLFGLIIGSFLTVCVYRIPLGRVKGPPDLDNDDEPVKEDAPTDEKGRSFSIVYPARSLCPECNNQLLWWHNIPLFSWLLLRGKCHFCKAKIPLRYPLIELLSALLCALSFGLYGFTPTAFVVYAFSCALVVISFIDIEYYIIPDVISIPGMVLGLALGGLNHFYPCFAAPLAPNFWWSLAGFAFGGGVLLLISELYYRLRQRVGLGFGDIKLLAMTGAFFGPDGAFTTMLAGSLVGSIIGLGMMAFGGRKMTYHIPFGPYLALGTILFIFMPDGGLLMFSQTVTGIFSQLFLWVGQTLR